uniref:Malate dehydrogenase 1B n=1 Tax=Rousettus aegyptiacus TaxID=9407 RepID=A0A7J8JHG8_ROUAE|nr:malate dehydrogenase 1B [Rousettus aegyptiacus]
MHALSLGESSVLQALLENTVSQLCFQPPTEWLNDLCKKNKWDHKNSPIIWRELLDRGGKGLLLGGYNEFLEHAQLYYGVTSSMTTEMMKVIAQENLMTHIEDEREKEALKQLIEPLNVWITRWDSQTLGFMRPAFYI